MATSTGPLQLNATKHFGGFNKRYKHPSRVLGCEMTFTVFFPPSAKNVEKFPILYFLSGLTCNDENFIIKSGAQRYAAQKGIALVAPDTSPRGLNVAGESDSWDFGVGAGFYLNATKEPWQAWRMYDYITQELPELLATHFPTLDMQCASMMGHSMGGHGALTIALKNPGKFKSISALSPIANPTQCPWGVKAFTGYLGEDRALWKQYDTVELLRQKQCPEFPLLVDTGTADPFLEKELKIDALEAALKEAGWDAATVRMQEGYDHSYFFISTFVEDHVNFHAQYLRA